MRKSFVPIYLSGIFVSLHYASILYVNSSFLSDLFQPRIVSLLFLSGALGSIIIFLLASRLLRWLGTRLLFFFFLLLASMSTLAIGFGPSPILVASAFIIYSSVLSLVYYCLDIFLEAVSIEKLTGGTRGLYLTIINASIAIAPLLAVFAVEGDDLKNLYLLSSLLLIPPILISLFFFRPRLTVPRGPIAKLPLKLWWSRKNIRRVTTARCLLEFFYVFMIIYTPMYLHDIIGFKWAEIGLIFPVMLLPFVLFEWPLGIAADRWYGEKEILAVGFAITGTSLLLMPWLGYSFFLWMAVLFASRVGASFIEIATESYFFKHVQADDSGLISIFRLTRPVAIIAGSIVGAVSLSLFSFDKIFLVLAFFVFIGLRESLYIRDTL